MVRAGGLRPLASRPYAFLTSAAHGGITEPATVYPVVGDLSAAFYRLPQLLIQLADWIAIGADAGRIAGDRSAAMLSSDARAILRRGSRLGRRPRRCPSRCPQPHRHPPRRRSRGNRCR